MNNASISPGIGTSAARTPLVTWASRNAKNAIYAYINVKRLWPGRLIL